jgi:hypothetical protein
MSSNICDKWNRFLQVNKTVLTSTVALVTLLVPLLPHRPTPGDVKLPSTLQRGAGALVHESPVVFANKLTAGPE